MASDDRDVVATRLAHEERDNTSRTSRSMMPEIVLHQDVAEYRGLYPNTLDPKHIGAVVSDGRSFTTFDSIEVRRDTSIGFWNRRWARAGEWCAGIMDPVGCFDVPFVRHADEATYVRALLWILARREGDWVSMERYNLVR